MNDPILGDEGTPLGGTTVPAEEQGQPPKADPSEARFERLERAMAELGNVVKSAAERVTNIPAPAAPQASPDAFLEEMSKDPQGVIGRVAREQAQALAEQQFNPTVMQMLETASQQLVAGQRQTVDYEFGLGTYDELFKEKVEGDLAKLRVVNPRAAADPATVEMLVQRHYGGANFDALMAKRKTLETARERGVSHLIPTGGVPRLRAVTGDEIPADVEQFLRDVEKATGEVVDRKRYAKVYYTGTESGPGRHRTNVVEWLKAVGADADTLKMYGGEKS